MRKVIADVVGPDAVWYSRPDADQKTLKIPEAESTNVGQTGFVGFGEYVYSLQEMDVKVTQSGAFPTTTFTLGSQFRIRVDRLLDENGDEMTDADNWMGAETPGVPHYVQTLTDFDETDVITNPKMIRLEHAGGADDDFGYVAFMFHVQTAGGTATVYFNRMKMNGPSGTNNTAYWTAVTNHLTFTTSFVGDVAEAPDGTLYLVGIEGGTNMVAYRSFDYGDNWVAIGNIAALSFNSGDACAVCTLGERVVFLVTDKTSDTDIYATYSDDGGYTWATQTKIVNLVGNVPSTIIFIDADVGSDGTMYAAFTTYDGAAGDTMRVIKSLDGINWENTTSPRDTGEDIHSLGIFATHFGEWGSMGVDVTDTHMRWRMSNQNDPTGSGWDGTGGDFLDDLWDSDGMVFTEVATRDIFNAGFVDTACVMEDSHGGTTYYTVVIFRSMMWSGIQYDEDFTSVWCANQYPSTADAHPNNNNWSRTQANAGTSALSNSLQGYMRCTSTAWADRLFYTQSNPTVPVERWANGMSAKFVMRVNSGYGTHVRMVLCSNASNKDVEFVLKFDKDNDQIILRDVNASSDVATADLSSSNWALDDFNEYILCAYQNEVYLYRAPWHRNKYLEVRPFELVLSNTTLQEDAYAADNDSFDWGVGIIALVGYNNAGTSDWCEVDINTDSLVGRNWDFDDDGDGRKCSYRPVGIMQGFGCLWSGNYAVEDDQWSLDTGATYEPENILVPSPRKSWKEPRQTTNSPNRVFEWWREDSDGNKINFDFDAIAVFNSNCGILAKLEGLNEAGGGATTIFDAGVSHYSRFWPDGIAAVDSINDDVVTLRANTSSWDEDLIPGQLASNNFRNWYMAMGSGAQAGQIYRIRNNDADKVYLYRDGEADGILADDLVVLFSDRFLYTFSARQVYPRLRLTLKLNSTYFFADDEERQARLGTLVLGKVYDLPDDEWDSKIDTVPNVTVVEGRAATRQWAENAQERRHISVAYTGNTDRGMGKTDVHEMFRMCRWGTTPIVWIDNDDQIDGIRSGQCHRDPILARVRGPVSQQRVAYNRLTQDGITYSRNIMDVGGIVLEEVL